MSSLSLSSATEFYQRYESKLITIIVVLLSIYLLAFAAKITWKLVPSEQQTQVNSSRSTQASNNTNKQSSQIKVDDLLSLNLFGDAQAQDAPEVQQAAEDVPETSLNLSLLGVVASNDPELGLAVIESKNQQESYAIGEKIQGTNVTLDEIFADRVIIKNRLTRETLMLEGLDYEEANRQKAQASNEQQSLAANSRTVRPNPQEIRDARAKLASSPDSFADFISLSPHRVENELIGYRVSPGNNATLFNSVGLKNGDIVVELNGLNLSDLQQSLEALSELQEADNLQLEIMRGSEFVSLDLDITNSTEDE